MKIVHVVTLVTPDGAFGGPVRVAMNQAKELQGRGHEVLVVGGAHGFNGSLPTEIDGVPVKLFRVRRLIPKAGFAGLASLRLVISAIRSIRQADVVHVHMARDLITTPIGWLSTRIGKRTFIQPHGMIDSSEKILAKILDTILVKATLKKSHGVLYLTTQERCKLLEVEEKQFLRRISNGVPKHSYRPDVDDCKNSSSLEILFLGRLHEIKRPQVLIAAVGQLVVDFPSLSVAFVGPDEGEQAAMLELISSLGLESNITLEGPVPPEHSLDRMRRADIYVLPSRSEVMPMGALEAMSVGLPVVLCSPCGIEMDVRSYEAGIVAGQNASELVDSIRPLLASRDLRKSMGTSGIRLINERYSIESAVNLLEEYYQNRFQKRVK